MLPLSELLFNLKAIGLLYIAKTTNQSPFSDTASNKEIYPVPKGYKNKKVIKLYK